MYKEKELLGSVWSDCGWKMLKWHWFRRHYYKTNPKSKVEIKLPHRLRNKMKVKKKTNKQNNNNNKKKKTNGNIWHEWHIETRAINSSDSSLEQGT